MNITYLRERVDTLEEENRQLRAALKPEPVKVPLRWNLSPAMDALLRVLLSREYVTTEMATAAMNGTPDRNNTLVRVQIFRLRKRLKTWSAPDCFAIEVVQARGYYMPHRREANRWLREESDIVT